MLSGKLLRFVIEADSDHIRTIQRHYEFLVDKLVAKHSGLVVELHQAEVLSGEEVELISSEVISFTQNEKLLSILSRKTRDQFDKFLDALDKTGQRHVHDHVTDSHGQLTWLNSLYVISVMRDDSVSIEHGYTVNIWIKRQ